VSGIEITILLYCIPAARTTSPPTLEGSMSVACMNAGPDLSSRGICAWVRERSRRHGSHNPRQGCEINYRNRNSQ
jgi:hypothetical protein